MPLIFIIIAFFGCVDVFAQSYQFVKSNEYPALAIYEISQKLAANGFFEIDLKRKGRIFKTPIDQMYLKTGSATNQILLILDLKLNSEARVLRISETEFVCHSQTSRGRPFSLYLKLDSQKEFFEICNSFLSKKNEVHSSRFYQLYRLMASPAHASNPECDVLNPPYKNLTQLKSSLDETSVVQGLGTCLSEVLRGSAQTFSGFKDSLVTLLTNPKNLWAEISAQATALKNFLVHIKDEVIQLKNSLSGLDSDLALHLGCQLGGEILTSIGLGALTGVGVVKLSTTLMQAVLKLKEIPLLLTRLNQMSKAGNTPFAREVLSCVASH